MDELELIGMAQFLAKDPLLQGLDVPQIRWVTEHFEKVQLKAGETLITQGEPASNFYIVRRGKIIISYPGSRGSSPAIDLYAGAHFGHEALLGHGRQPYTAVAAEEGEVYRASAQKFSEILKQYPQIKTHLQTVSSGRRKVSKKFGSWLQENEQTLLVERKHWLFLISALLLPILLFVLSIYFFPYALDNQNRWLIFALAGLATFAVIWFIWGFNDYLNDFYIVTDKRVVITYKILGIYNNRFETPLSSITSNDVTRSLVGQIFDYGDISIRTYMGNLSVTHIAKPDRMVRFIDGYKKKVVSQNSDLELERVKKAVKTAMENRDKAPGWDSVKPLSPPKPESKVKPLPFFKRFGRALRSLSRMRFEEGDVITYRRHWYSLVGRIWWIVLLLFGVVILSSYLGIQMDMGVTTCSIGTLIELVLLGLLVYRIWDWSNDIFQLTKTQIIDIDKKPLGPEGKKTASLDAPDIRIEHVRPSLLANLLNFGNVIVYIGPTQFNLEGVYNPDRVHQDVAARRDALLTQKTLDQDSREGARLMNWLMAFWDQTREIEKNNDTSGGAPVP